MNELATALNNDQNFSTSITNLIGTKANQSTTFATTEVDNNLILKATQSTTYTKTEIDNNLALKTDKATTYANTETDNSLDTKQIKFIIGGIPATNISILFDHGDNEFRAIHVNSPLSIQTTNAAYLTLMQTVIPKQK